MADGVSLKFCPHCAEVGCLDDKHFHYHIKGYKGVYNCNLEKCAECGTELIDCGMPSNDYNVITHISLDPKFLESMIELYHTDIIEYNLKMSQFRANAEQIQQSQKSASNNQARCPKCGSTNIQMVPRKWSLLTGFATNKTDRVCVNCKTKF